MNSESIEPLAPRPGPIFEWDRPRGRPFWLVLFVLFSVVGHAAAFYFFRVVYPPQKRELIKPLEVTVLDPSDAMTRDVLSRIDDRAVSFDARIELDLQGAGSPQSPEEEVRRRVAFVPFFKDHQPDLMEPPPIELEDRGRLFPSGGVYLPLPSNVRAAQPEARPAEPGVPLLSLRWEAVERKTVRPFEWNPDDPTSRPADFHRSVIYIGVDRFGRVAHALPEQGAGAEMDSAILASLRGMRFEAIDAERIDWAWAEVRW